LAVEAPQTKFTAEKRAAFVEAYRHTGEKKAAAAAAGVNVHTVYNHLHENPEFRDECEAARHELLGEIVSRLRHCAIEGVVKRTYDKDGNLASETRVYDSKLMLAWLKRLERQKWGDKVQVDQNVTVKEPSTRVNDIPRDARDHMREALAAMRRSDAPSKN
jgi:hypothetical protein